MKKTTTISVRTECTERGCLAHDKTFDSETTSSDPQELGEMLAITMLANEHFEAAITYAFELIHDGDWRTTTKAMLEESNEQAV